MTKKLSLVVPTVGRSPILRRCLDALRGDGGDALELIVVAQGAVADAEFPQADQVLRQRDLPGFAAANNLGFAAASAELIGTINDDAIVEEGFCRKLLDLFEREPRAAAVQGLNFQLDHPQLIDGGGIGWNRFWQAVQLGHGRELRSTPGDLKSGAPLEIFGVSATAAIYRRQALEAVALGPGEFFDERLFTYYEDVELACRLRRAGFLSFLEPAARARHLGSASLATLPFSGRAQIHGNRLLVLAEQLGRGFWPRLPWILLRDVVDSGRLLSQGEGRSALGIALGAARAARRLGGFAHLRRPCLEPETFHRFPAELPWT